MGGSWLIPRGHAFLESIDRRGLKKSKWEEGCPFGKDPKRRKRQSISEKRTLEENRIKRSMVMAGGKRRQDFVSSWDRKENDRGTEMDLPFQGGGTLEEEAGTERGRMSAESSARKKRGESEKLPLANNREEGQMKGKR